VAEDAVVQSRQHLGLAEARHDVGFAPRFDVTREQVQLASNELNLLGAQNNFAVARETLRNAMGLEDAIDFDIADEPQAETIDVDEKTALNRAYANRPEILGLQAQERALEEQTAALRKDYLPSLTSDGYYQWSGTRYPLQSNWNIGANVTFDVFNGGLTRAQVGELQANLANLQHNETLLRQNIALEVRQAILNLRQAGQSIGVSATGLRQARENLELAEGRYQTGVGNVIEITDAQAALTSAEARYVQAAYNYRNSLAALERAIAQSIAPGDAMTRKVSSR
jgi:outer membrane protein TolC